MSNIYDKASLVLIPSGTKTSKVYSQKPVNGDGDFTFSRSTAATRVNADGNIEKETQNLLTNSNTFTSWDNIGGSMVGGQAGYDGSNNAYLFTMSSGANIGSQTNTQSGVQTYSVYAKGNTNNGLRLYAFGSTNCFAYFDLNIGAVETTSGVIDATIEDKGNGWYKCAITFNQTNTNLYMFMSNNSNSNAGSGSITIQDAQLEQGMVARDVLTTTTTAVEGGITDNVPRLDYTDASCPSLLLEPQRTNIVSQSEYMQYSNNVNVIVTDNDIASPEGLDNAAKAVPTTTNSNHIVRSNNLAGLTSQGTYSVSVFAKQNGYKYINVGAGFGSTATPLPTFDLNTGTIVANSSNGTIEDYGDGWYKCTAIIQIASTALYPIIGILNNSQSGSYAGDNTSAVYLYGHQIEAGSYSTSYIPTYGSAVTRNVEACYITTNVDSLVNNTQGSIFMEIQPVSIPEYFERVLRIDDGTEDNVIRWNRYGTQNFQQYITNAGNIEAIFDLGNAPKGTSLKVCLVYNNNDVRLYVNGSKDGTDTSVTMPSVNYTRLMFANNTAGSLLAPQRISQFISIPTALSNQEAIDLTTI